MDEVDIPYWEQRAPLQDISTREESLRSLLMASCISRLCVLLFRYNSTKTTQHGKKMDSKQPGRLRDIA